MIKYPAVFVAILTACLIGCADQGSAQKTVNAYIKQNKLDATATCATYDSDGDGYVSCTLVMHDPDGKTHLEAFECAGSYTLNDGCRIPKPTIRQYHR